MTESVLAAPRRVLLETLANDGRYMSWRRSEHVPEFRKLDLLVVEVPDSRVRCFGVRPPAPFSDDDVIRMPVLPGIGRSSWAGELLEQRLGAAYPSSSLRTLYPAAETGLGGWALKLHLPDELRGQFGKNLASKEITRADAMIGPMFTELLRRLDFHSPHLGVVEEPSGVVVSFEGGGPIRELGAVFRRLPEVEWIPGFSLYSPARGPLRRALGRVPLGVQILRSRLGRSASRFDRIDRCLECFVDPLLDLFFSLASQGVTLQMHSQNILFEVDPQSSSTRRVWVRDLAGANYAPEYRAARGLRDLLAEVTEAVPGVSQEILSEWFTRQGQLRRRFEERFLFGHAYDAHLSPFLYQLMTGFWRAGFFGLRDLQIFQVAVQRRAQAAALHHGFDTGLLKPIATPREGLAGALLRGLELRALFRPRP